MPARKRRFSLLGGKLTAYRAMSEDLVNRLGKWFEMKPAWTALAPLPGGDLDTRGLEGLLADLAEQHAYLPKETAQRLAQAYGRRAFHMLGGAKTLNDLGPRLVGDLYQRELDYLRAEEWAQTADDVLFRRTKLGVGADPREVEVLKTAMQT
jgi:glycerol-3-phosphate dehydrogenase